MTIFEDKYLILCISKYLAFEDLIHFWMVNRHTFQVLMPKMEQIYKKYIDNENTILIRDMNFKAKLIDEFTVVTPVVMKTMFEFIIMCYEHWHLLSYDENLKSKLCIPTNKIFTNFLTEKTIDINKIFYKPFTHCTMYHTPSKSISYYRTLRL